MKNQKNWLDLYRAACRAGVPLVAINTPDPASTIREIGKVLPTVKGHEDAPILAWDVCRGTVAVNEAGLTYASSDTEGDPAAFLLAAQSYPDGTVVFWHNSQACFDRGLPVVQGCWNLRDEYKQNQRMLVLLAADHQLPKPLARDVVVIDEPLPDQDRLREIAVETAGELDKATLERVVQALRGLSALTKEGVDIAQLWQGKRKAIERRGLTFDEGSETFDDIRGLSNAKDFGEALFTGPHPPAVVVRVEELEKSMAGSQGDLSGTSQDALQVFLSAMEDNGWAGQIAFGPPGTGKSLYSKALANTFDRLPLVFDINATKEGLVGSSEANVRNVVKTLIAIGGREVFFVASMNKMNVPPELVRRFRYGVWMFDMPDDEERAAMWELHRGKFEIDAKDKQPDDTDWSGSDIRNICEMAWKMGRSLKDVLQFASSNGKANPEVVKAARDAAEGKYISASKPGVYRRQQAGSKRRISI
jgi:hypothetical protein